MPAPAYVYLASQSPRRRQLLAQIGVRHELLLPAADEDAEALEALHPGELPAAYVQRVTRAKLDAGCARQAAPAAIRADPVRRHHGRAGPPHPRQAGRCR
jgi:predicted house-cleaning NTP pyrophosphatase (Maf/HAM1 superfamily)